MLPILLVLALMLRWRWGAHKAGPAAWAAGLLLGAIWFGLTPQVFWVSQAKGVLLSVFVLAVMWPALLLYHWVDQNGGIEAVAKLLQAAIPNRGMCLLLLAWGLSGLLEGLAGFGIPIAVVAPMLVALGVPPLRAVAAVAVGHSWAATFGDMGVILQTLLAVVGMDAAQVVPWAGLLLGAACVLCGLGAALVLGELRQWPNIIGLSLIMGATQYGLAAVGLTPVAAFGAGLAGLCAYWGGARVTGGNRVRTASSPRPSPPSAFAKAPADKEEERELAAAKFSTEPGAFKTSDFPSEEKTAVSSSGAPTTESRNRQPALLALWTYGALMVLMAALTMHSGLRSLAQGIAWKPHFAEVKSAAGFVTPAGLGQVFRPLAHPGTLIVLVTLASMALRCSKGRNFEAAQRAARATWRSAGAASLGILSMVGLSTLMDHCGMSYLLAQGLSHAFGAAYPLVSPYVGILGAFATGSNNNSNVLFGSLQKNVALLLGVNAPLLAAAQTAGGSLGSMLAPAKIIVGCSTVGQVGHEGQVLRQTVPCGLVIGLLLGILTLALSRL